MMEPQTPMGPPRELVVVGSPPDVPSSQGSNATGTPVDRIWEPTSYTLVFLSGRQNTMMEVATGVAHPPGGLHHNKKIPLDYTRVEVHTVKPEFMQWRIDYATSSKFNSILKALFDIFYSMQKSLSSSMIKSMQQPLDLYSRRCREEHGMGL